MSPIYSQVKPVKMDAASNKPTVKSVSLAEGPRTPDPVPSTKSSWTQSFISAVVKTVSSTAEQPKTLPPDKVNW